MTAVRLTCVVPFCRRTRSAPRLYEWICGDHWPAVPLMTRRVLARAKRRRDRETFDLAWRRCKAAAIEIAAGVRR